MSQEKRFKKVATAMRRFPDVSPSTMKGFGSTALCVGDKIFAMLAPKHGFVVKLPRARVDELIDAGAGTRFTPGPNRTMKEWFVVSEDSDLNWTALSTEAMKFVGGIEK